MCEISALFCILSEEQAKAKKVIWLPNDKRKTGGVSLSCFMHRKAVTEILYSTHTVLIGLFLCV